MDTRIVIPEPLLNAIERAWTEFMLNDDPGDLLTELLNRLPDQETREAAVATVEKRARILT